MRIPARTNEAVVRDYWNSVHGEYLDHVGTTFQAGRMGGGSTFRESNLWLARAAGLVPGQRVLDAGCGVCGPAIDIARAINRLAIVGITLSERQADTARRLIAGAGLSDRVRVLHGDYHRLPVRNASFDVVVFFESLVYARDVGGLFREVNRVLPPGGRVYVKDVFRRHEIWSDQERRELRAFDEAYACRTPEIEVCRRLLVAAGFEQVQSRDLSDMATTAHVHRAMVDCRDRHRMTPFGKRHYRPYSCLPVFFGELTARKPGHADDTDLEGTDA